MSMDSVIRSREDEIYSYHFAFFYFSLFCMAYSDCILNASSTIFLLKYN